MAITEDKAKVYSLILDMMLRVMFALVSLFFFSWVMIKVINEPRWEWVGAEAIMSGTIIVVFRYYFPSKKK